MSKRLNLVGEKFNLLTVISDAGTSKDNQSQWKCKCICGGYIIVPSNRLKNGITKSCGCLFKKGNRFIHGESRKTVEYRAWNKIKERCYSITSKDYNKWGGRGVKMCDEWRNDFLLFLRDMGRRPSKNHSIDRIDNNGNYEPSNCRWATKIEQNRNTRKNVYLEYRGIRKTLSEWSHIIGVNYGSIVYHLKRKTFSEVILYYYNLSKPLKEFIYDNKTIKEIN